MWCDDGPVIVREQLVDDYEAIRHVYAEAFRQPSFRPPQRPGAVPPEVALFEALWAAGDAIPELSFTALAEGEVVGHVTASRATIAAEPVVAVGPIGVLPDHQRTGIGGALMDALLVAADAATVPLVVLARRSRVLQPLRVPSGRGVGGDVAGAGMGNCPSRPDL
jgi:putative acetyltransferase